jgi:hypothetical protein
MEKSSSRIAALLLVLVAVLALSIAAPRVIEAGPQHEYKFVRLVDEGAMPSITDALNREAERGWRLEQMSVIQGEPGAVYLVFAR